MQSVSIARRAGECKIHHRVENGLTMHQLHHFVVGDIDLGEGDIDPRRHKATLRRRVRRRRHHQIHTRLLSVRHKVPELRGSGGRRVENLTVVGQRDVAELLPVPRAVLRRLAVLCQPKKNIAHLTCAERLHRPFQDTLTLAERVGLDYTFLISSTIASRFNQTPM